MSVGPEQYRNISSMSMLLSKRGWKYVDVPWLVGPAADMYTRPLDKSPMKVSDGEYLVGSGEQGFIDLLIQGKIDPGKYQTITPCFRDDIEDETHRRWFMKLELFSFGMIVTPTIVAEQVLNCLISTMLVENDDNITIAEAKTEHELNAFDVLDMNLNGLEIGSYGARTISIGGERMSYVFGTGIAEPRFTIALGKRKA